MEFTSYQLYDYFIVLIRKFFIYWILSNIIYIVYLLAMILISTSLLLHVINYLFYKLKFKKQKEECLVGLSDTPRVSIVIPIRSEPLEVIKRNVKRILKQTYPLNRIELIIVSDDSPDYARKIKREISMMIKGRLKFVFINRDFPKGYKAGALNEALKKAAGKYLVVLDADVIIPENYLSELVSFMEAHPEYAGAVSDLGVINSQENELCEAQSIAWSFLKKAIFFGRKAAGFPVQLIGACCITVSYTHLTLPTTERV